MLSRKAFFEFLKKTKDNIKNEVGDSHKNPIKVGVFLANLGVGGLARNVYDLLFRDAYINKTKECECAQGMPDSISLWASKDDDEVISKHLDDMQKIVKDDPDEFINHKKGLLNGFSQRIKPWMVKGYAKRQGQYAKLWSEVGDAIKFGIIKSGTNRSQFASFLRFQSTKSKGNLITLDQYLSRMKSGQEKIFYVIVNKEQLEKSPFLEMLRKKDIEVILFTGDIDQYMMHHLVEYKGKKFHDLSKDGFRFDKENLEKSFKELARWWRLLLDDDNVDVNINHLLVDTPCVVVNSNYGLSSYLGRLSKSWALSEANKQPYMRSKRVLEINPRHPIVRKLRCQVAKDPKDENVKRIARAMYGIALLESGLELTQLEIYTFHPYTFIEGEEEPEETKVGIIGQKVWAFVENVFPLPWKNSSSSSSSTI